MGSRRGHQGCDLGQACGHRAHGGKAEDEECIPVTKLGLLMKDMKIRSLEEIYLFFLPIKAFVAIGDYNGHVGLGVKCSKQPDLWKETVFIKSPCQELTDHPVKIHTRVCTEDPGSSCGYNIGVFIQK
ncbi:40S ribosomal protein S2 [Sciurus carolinensis]|uniref:40S ribosomal protein S2 n=1 Tax=Sciurus carolinensis TaxID=30640 RepID=A0AA41MYX2_SCICA|nr:40S ribosomal protein S2 [Sciurus carolinensis]